MGAASASLAMPDAAERVAAEVLAAIARKWPAMNWSERRLHFIAIGGAGMSGLALVCHRLGARVTGSDRAESSYLARLREAGLEPARGPRRRRGPGRRRGRGLDRDRRRQPGAGPRPRAGPDGDPPRTSSWPSSARSGRLIAVAGTHGKTTTAGMLVHALRALGADPAFFVGGELPGAGPDGAPANAGWGEGELGGRRGRRVRRQLPRASAGGRGRHQRRARPPRALVVAGRAGRRRSRASPPASDRRRAGPRPRARPDRAGPRPRSCGSTTRDPGRPTWRCRCRVATTC